MNYRDVNYPYGACPVCKTAQRKRYGKLMHHTRLQSSEGPVTYTIAIYEDCPGSGQRVPTLFRAIGLLPDPRKRVPA